MTVLASSPPSLSCEAIIDVSRHILVINTSVLAKINIGRMEYDVLVDDSRVPKRVLHF
jgi:hypothetical protein